MQVTIEVPGAEPVRTTTEALSGLADAIGSNGGVNGELRAIVERIERLEEDKAAIAADIADIYKEAKGGGFDVKVLRKIIARRKRDRAEIEEEEAILALYLAALGMA